MGSPLTPEQVNAYQSNLASMVSSQDSTVGGYIMDMLPQGGNYKGNGTNDYWNRTEALREVVDPLSAPLDKTSVTDLQRAESYLTQYYDDQGISAVVSREGWANESLLTDSDGHSIDPIHAVPDSAADFAAMTHDQNLPTATDLQGKLDANIAFLNSEAHIGWATGDPVPLIDGLLMEVGANGLAVVTDDSITHVADNVVAALNAAYNALHPDEAVNLTIQNESGYDATDSDDFTDSDYYLGSYESGSYYYSSSYQDYSSGGSGGGIFGPDDPPYEAERVSAQNTSTDKPPTLIHGTGGADLLFGTPGANVFFGSAGGGDVFVGKGGGDLYRFASGDSPSAKPDTIVDFQSGSDQINLKDVHLSASDILSIQTDRGRTLVNVDQGGDGTVDFSLIVVGANAVQQSDIIWS